ncbi:unnamed protein product [Cochlearia groenlandica]
MSNDKENFSVTDLTSVLNDVEDEAVDMKVIVNLTPIVRNRVDSLWDIQVQHDELEAKFLEEKAALEAKYQKMYQPLYTKVTKSDEEVLEYLKDIKWCKIEEPKGFKLKFFFDSNPYFKNTVLTKSYHMHGEDDQPFLEKSMGTEIDWYRGKCLTRKILEKIPENNEVIIEMEDCESFFNFFNPLTILEEDFDEDKAEENHNMNNHDYNIGTTIQEKIIPRVVLWFTSEAVKGEEFIFGDHVEENEEEGI